MKKLNQGENIDQDDINLFRLTISPPFSIGGQEDVSEFVSYILNDIDESEAYNTNVDDLVFRKAYKYTLEKTLTCQNCDEIVQKYEDSFILHIQCKTSNFISNFDEALT